MTQVAKEINDRIRRGQDKEFVHPQELKEA